MGSQVKAKTLQVVQLYIFFGFAVCELKINEKDFFLSYPLRTQNKKNWKRRKKALNIFFVLWEDMMAAAASAVEPSSGGGIDGWLVESWMSSTNCVFLNVRLSPLWRIFFKDIRFCAMVFVLNGVIEWKIRYVFLVNFCSSSLKCLLASVCGLEKVKFIWQILVWWWRRYCCFLFISVGDFEWLDDVDFMDSLLTFEGLLYDNH